MILEYSREPAEFDLLNIDEGVNDESEDEKLAIWLPLILFFDDIYYNCIYQKIPFLWIVIIGGNRIIIRANISEPLIKILSNHINLIS